MAEALGIPIATGGDRHGCKPNTVINLTNADTFEEFVHEIRVEKKSEVVLMPEYEQPLHSRQMQSFAEILKHYPEFRREPAEMVRACVLRHRRRQGSSSRLSSHGWRLGGPKWLRAAIWTLGFLGSPEMRPFFRVARSRKDRVPYSAARTKFEIIDLEDISRSLSSGAVSDV